MSNLSKCNMVYKEAARKTGAYMVLAVGMSLGAITFMTEDLVTPTGRVTSTGQFTGQGWLVFVLGIFIGCLMIGTYFYLAHIEAKR